jgi:hypothetical protein
MKKWYKLENKNEILLKCPCGKVGTIREILNFSLIRIDLYKYKIYSNRDKFFSNYAHSIGLLTK